MYNVQISMILQCTRFTTYVCICSISQPRTYCNLDCRGVRLAKNGFGSVFGSVLQKTAVFGSVSVSLN